MLHLTFLGDPVAAAPGVTLRWIFGGAFVGDFPAALFRERSCFWPAAVPPVRGVKVRVAIAVVALGAAAVAFPEALSLPCPPVFTPAP